MYIGIDLGGSHIGLGLVDENGNIISKKEVYTDITYTREKIVKCCKEMIDVILDSNKLSLMQIEYIGIGIPGTINDTTILRAENMNIYNFNIVDEFKKTAEYINVPIYLENDANCATIAEFACGNLKGVNNGILLTIGTGIGSGIIINKKLYKGANRLAGEIGHMCIKPEGLQCNCGQKGCFEKYASMKNLRMKVSKILKLDNEITGEELLILLRGNKPELNNILDEYIEFLSIGIANYINIIDPDKVVLGGSIVHFKEIVLKELNKRVNEKTYNKFTNYQLDMANVGNDAGIIGAALQKEYKECILKYEK